VGGVKRLTVDEAEAGIAAGDRGVLARAITLVESTRADDRERAEELVTRILPRTGKSLRVGISGVPGVGKSTFIEALGKKLTGERGHKVAVLAVDPSSALSGGSILGDKTRMPALAADPRAFIRPSPAADKLGGVARRTREAMLLCEAAGYDVVLVETVGVGQSETEVASMVDFFLLLLLPGAGDELQGIKRGIVEIADAVAVNKADGDNVPRAKLAAREISSALHYLRHRVPAWTPRATTVSALTGEGLDELWATVLEHRGALEASGDLARVRREQAKRWMWSIIEERLLDGLRADPKVAAHLGGIERSVEEGALSPERAARQVLADFLGRTGG
jgi:LAO/AO transport system kinase